MSFWNLAVPSLQIFSSISLVIIDLHHQFLTISLSVWIWLYYWVTHFVCIGLIMLIFKSIDAPLSGAIPLEIWKFLLAESCHNYHSVVFFFFGCHSLMLCNCFWTSFSSNSFSLLLACALSKAVYSTFLKYLTSAMISSYRLLLECVLERQDL